MAEFYLYLKVLSDLFKNGLFFTLGEVDERVFSESLEAALLLLSAAARLRLPLAVLLVIRSVTIVCNDSGVGTSLLLVLCKDRISLVDWSPSSFTWESFFGLSHGHSVRFSNTATKKPPVSWW